MKKDIDQIHNDISCVEEKIDIIADEVIDILKQLSQENEHQLSSKLIAEKMYVRDSVKKMLNARKDNAPTSSSNSNILKDITDTIMNRFSDFAPFSLGEKLNELQHEFQDEALVEETAKWMDSSFTIVRKYIDSLSIRNKELEEFIRQTMQNLQETEIHLSAEISSQENKFSEDREFEDSISDHMNMIRHDFNKGDLKSIQEAVMSKIDNINKGITKKREQDILRKEQTEKALKSLTTQIKGIKKEADEIKQKTVKLEIESSHDELTGLYNRKAYNENVLETIAYINRYNEISSLIVCDIDYFKKINDSFGHKVGDLVLKKLSILLREKLRANEFISRYGGEEFAIIVPHAPLNEARKIGEGLRDYIDKFIFSYKDQKIPVTVSVGVSVFRKDDDCFTVFDRADEALYLAKKSGRNNVKTEADVRRQTALKD
jgi:diguanylate cyclase